MKKLYILLVSLSFIPLSDAQSEWQEHFSHDRTAYRHHGHFVVNGRMVLLMANWESPMNTLETIQGNTKKEVVVISPYNTYSKVKTTNTGINEKEILLVDPFDYDIPGLGNHSVRSKDDSLFTRSIYWINEEYPYISDAYIPLDPLQNRECITYSNDWLTLNNNDEVINSVPLQNTFEFYEAPGQLFQLNGSILNPLHPPSGHPGGVNLGAFDLLNNDPYRNQIIVVDGSEMNRYTIEQCTKLGTEQLEGVPIDILFTEEGFYYLTESLEDFKVYLYSEALEGSELWYKFPKEEEISEFKISEFDIIEEDLYLFGVIKRTIPKGLFSYVQKRTRNMPFAPKRKDLSLDSMYITGSPTGTNPSALWNYDYWFKVTNHSDDTVHHFSLYSDNLTDEYSFPMRFANINIAADLAPGESFEGTGTYSYYEQFSFSLHIAGVDFGLDADMNNNSITANIETVFTEDILPNVYTIAPNPASNYLSVLGETQEIKYITIIDNEGRIMEKVDKNLQNIEIVHLAKGQYWLNIIGQNGIERHPFIKM